MSWDAQIQPGTMQLGAIGADILATIYDSNDPTGLSPVNLNGATVKNFILMSPSGETATVTASFLTDGSDGKLVYTTAEGDIDEIGQWSVQAEITLPVGYSGTTTIGLFLVYP